MPLRDHFQPPVSKRHSWDALFAGWPAMIVQQLFDILPEGYVSAPSVFLFGDSFVNNVSPTVIVNPAEHQHATSSDDGGVESTMEPKPTLTVESYLSEQDNFEVSVYDTEFGSQLVATIEIVSPANKDRPENRAAFVAKVAALLQKDVCVSVVDLVTEKQFNLYAELLEFVGLTDPHLGPTPPHLYAVTLRARKRPEKRSLLDLWYYPMTLGQPLPTLPIWLNPDLRVLLPLDSSYEETCRLLHIS